MATASDGSSQSRLVELDLVARTLRSRPLFDRGEAVTPLALALDAERFYVTANDGSFRTYELIDDAMVLRATATGLGECYDPEVRDGRAILSSSTGLAVLDVRDPTALSLLARQVGIWPGEHVEFGGDVVWLSNGASLRAWVMRCE